MTKCKAALWLVVFLIASGEASREGRAQQRPITAPQRGAHGPAPQRPGTATRQGPESSGSVEIKVKQGLEGLAAALARNDIPDAWVRVKDTWKVAEHGLDKQDPLRVRVVVAYFHVSGMYNYESKRLEAASDDLTKAVRASMSLPRGDPTRIMVLIAKAFVETDRRIPGDRGARVEETISRLVADVSRAIPAGDPSAVRVQNVVDDFVWKPMLDRANRDAADPAAEARLRGELDRFRKALERVQAEESWRPWGALVLARYQWERRHIGAAEATLKETVLAGAARDEKAPPYFRANYWSLVSLVATERREFPDAREAGELAVDLCHEYRLPKLSQALNNLGLLLLRLGDYRAARSRLQQAVEIYAGTPELEKSFQRPFALTNLAKTFEGTNDLDEAERLHREALSLAREVDDSNREPIVCLCKNNLGINRYTAGAFVAARAEFEEAREMAGRIFGTGDLHVAELDVNLGWVALAQDRVEEAERRFRDALGIIEAEEGDSHRHAEVLGYLARVLTRTGRLAEARGCLDRALRLRRSTLARVLDSSLSERDRLAVVQELRSHPESRCWPGVFDTALDLASDLGVPPGVQYGWLLDWKGAVTRQIPPRAADLGDKPEVRRLAEEREAVLRELRNASTVRPKRAQRKEHEARLARLESQADVLELQLRDSHPAFRRGARGKGIGPDEVEAALAPGSALLDVIEIHRFRSRDEGEGAGQDRRYIGFLVRPDVPPARVEFGDADPIDRAVRTAIRGLEGEDDDITGPLASLSALIRAPLLTHLDGVGILVVAGDGMLHRLPLGALSGNDPGTYWVEALAFASVPTAQSLVDRRRRPPTGATGALVVGGVDYGRLADEWPFLEATRSEAEEVARAFEAAEPDEPVDCLMGTAANEPALRELLPRRKYAHLATHGFFRNPRRVGEGFETFGVLAQLDSGIVLARSEGGKPNDPDNNQLLTAEEVGWLDLSQVELVALSACSSGLGHISAGQGVVGLLGAFDRAGVAATLGSLWKVEDNATAALMIAFYRNLWSVDKPVGPAQALRAAQREMIRSDRKTATGEAFSHPRFWAAFILSGDPFPRPHARPPA